MNPLHSFSETEVSETGLLRLCQVLLEKPLRQLNNRLTIVLLINGFRQHCHPTKFLVIGSAKVFNRLLEKLIVIDWLWRFVGNQWPYCQSMINGEAITIVTHLKVLVNHWIPDSIACYRKDINILDCSTNLLPKINGTTMEVIEVIILFLNVEWYYHES